MTNPRKITDKRLSWLLSHAMCIAFKHKNGHSTYKTDGIIIGLPDALDGIDVAIKSEMEAHE